MSNVVRNRDAGSEGKIIGMGKLSAAPTKALLAKFGFAPENMLAPAHEQMASARESAQ